MYLQNHISCICKDCNCNYNKEGALSSIFTITLNLPSNQQGNGML